MGKVLAGTTQGSIDSIVPESYKLHETMTVVGRCPQDFLFLQRMPFLDDGCLQAVGMSLRFSVAPQEPGGIEACPEAS